ncbi:putative tyrosine--tRNA ligase [Cooperia oncophora]
MKNEDDRIRMNGIQLSEEAETRKSLILRNLQEALGVDKLEKQLSTDGKVVHLYWGTATTGKPHVGYFVPMRKIADFLQAGLKAFCFYVTVLFADLHAFLDNMKSTWELLENRVIYYENIIKALLMALNVPIERLHFVKGTTYQLSRSILLLDRSNSISHEDFHFYAVTVSLEPFSFREYTFDVLRLCSQVSQRDALKAGAEVVKQVDGQFGGVDQRKIFILAEEQLPKLKLGKRWHLMNPMVPGLTGSKMSRHDFKERYLFRGISEIDSKIDLLDSREVVERKILGASCLRQEEDNGVLAFFNYVLIPIVSPNPLVVADKEFFSYEEIKESFLSGALSAEDLKKTLIEFLNELLAKVQDHCKSDVVRDALEKGYKNVDEHVAESTQHPVVQITDQQLSTVQQIIGGDKLIGDDDGTLRSSIAEGRAIRLIGDDDGTLRSSIAEGRAIRVTFTIHPKGRFHLGFLMGLLKMKSIVSRGISIEGIVLISDMEAFLDNEKVSWNAREARSEYFYQICSFFIEHLGLKDSVRALKSADIDSVFSKDYVLNMYKMASSVTRDETTVCEGTSLSGNLVPLFYALNHHLLKTDLAILGEDSVAIANLAVKLWSRMKTQVPTQVAFSTLPGCDGKKMSCSNPDFLLEAFDTPKQVKVKVARSFCEPQNLKGNVAMMLSQQFIFPLLSGSSLDIVRSAENGGNISVTSYEELEKEFMHGSNPDFPLHPGDLKNAVVGFINRFFDPVRERFASSQASLIAAAFPSSKKGKK